MLYVYFTLASVLWWFVIAFNLFLIVVGDVTMRRLSWWSWIRALTTWRGIFALETLYAGYHMFCWLPPIVVLIIAVANDKLGYDQDLWYVSLCIFISARSCRPS